MIYAIIKSSKAQLGMKHYGICVIQVSHTISTDDYDNVESAVPFWLDADTVFALLSRTFVALAQLP